MKDKLIHFMNLTAYMLKFPKDNKVTDLAIQVLEIAHDSALEFDKHRLNSALAWMRSIDKVPDGTLKKECIVTAIKDVRTLIQRHEITT